MATKKENVNPDLDRERKKCSFQTSELTNWWLGGPKNVEVKRFREKYFLEDPEIADKVPMSYLSHKEKYEETLRKISVVIRKSRELKAKTGDGVDHYKMLVKDMWAPGITSYGNPIGLHMGMFLEAIRGQGNEEQQKEWLEKAENLAILGTYAQTELGHGTFVRGLETTATYDPQTKEFVLNTPKKSSYKFWPGGMGHSANHCILIAQLVTQGQVRGVFPFILQIRDLDTHMPLKGVTVGEIGAKFGMDTANNGFLGLDHVRIPRKNMLMKNAQVLEDGTFIKAPSNVLTYGTMVLVRVNLVNGSSWGLAKVATIAIRYSAVRRQSPIDPKEPEVQIMDHLTQQHKLFPQLAKSVIFKIAADYIRDLYNAVMSELGQGQLARLPELHALSCCLKAVCTTDASMGVEICRLACGGHGFLASSNFASTYGLVTAAQTYEGETIVMLLQTARSLLKAWAIVLQGKQLTPTLSYLSKINSKATTQRSWDASIPGMIEAFQYTAGRLVQSAYENVEARRKEGSSQERAVNDTSIELAKAAEIHCRSFLIEAGYLSIQNLVKTLSPELGAVLLDLLELFAVDSALQQMGLLMRYVRISLDDLSALQSRLVKVLGRIRPNAVGIVDSFDFCDAVLNSTLGAYDGNVYDRLLEDAMKSPLNQEPVNRSFEMYLKPIMNPSKLEEEFLLRW